MVPLWRTAGSPHLAEGWLEWGIGCPGGLASDRDRL